jgi:hypothetical protein
MNRLLIAVVMALGAFLIAPVGCGSGPVQPAALGGAPGLGGGVVGGQSPVSGAAGRAAGGTIATGGAVATGGDPATGGGVAIEWPSCSETQKAGPIKRHPLGRKRHGPITKRVRSSYVVLDLPGVFHLPLADALDQDNAPWGPLGSCTGNAALQDRLSHPFSWRGTLDLLELEKIAVGIYSGATKRDAFPGTYPPTDTGSDGQSAIEEAISRGYFAGYESPKSFEDVQRALQQWPCIAGIDWYDGFDVPDRCGAVKKTGAVRGGHEIEVAGYRRETKQILARTSWGKFGVQWRNMWGYFWITFGDFSALLDAGGDVQCPTLP